MNNESRHTRRKDEERESAWNLHFYLIAALSPTSKKKKLHWIAQPVLKKSSYIVCLTPNTKSEEWSCKQWHSRVLDVSQKRENRGCSFFHPARFASTRYEYLWWNWKTHRRITRNKAPKTETVDCWLLSEILNLRREVQCEGILLFMVMRPIGGKVKLARRPEIFHFNDSFVSFLRRLLHASMTEVSCAVERRLHSIKDSH